MRLGASTWTTNCCFMQEVGKKIVHLEMHEISTPYQLSADICECYAMLDIYMYWILFIFHFIALVCICVKHSMYTKYVCQTQI